jgi:hypothetical protein
MEKLHCAHRNPRLDSAGGTPSFNFLARILLLAGKSFLTHG